MSLSGKVALVTGATGFLGGRVARRLLAEGIEVRALVRRNAPLPEGARPVQGDLLDAGSLAGAAEGADFVVHCAAYLSTDADLSRQVNAEGTRALAEEALRAGCRRFVHLSTMSVYDMRGRDLIDEETPLWEQVGHPYSQTKADADRIVMQAGERGLAYTILRPPAILGAHPTSFWGEIVPRSVQEGKFKMPDHAHMYYVQVDNLAEAVLLAAATPAAAGQCYNIADGYCKGKDYASRVRAALGMEEPPPVEGKAWTGTYSVEKAQRELGFVPRESFAEGMAEIEQYLRQTRGRA